MPSTISLGTVMTHINIKLNEKILRIKSSFVDLSEFTRGIFAEQWDSKLQ